MTGYSATWAFSGPSTDSLKERISGLLDLHFVEHDTDVWGWFWETPAGTLPLVKIYGNIEDEDGILFVHGHPEVTALIDGVNLDEAQFRAIEALGGTPIEAYGDLST